MAANRGSGPSRPTVIAELTFHIDIFLVQHIEFTGKHKLIYTVYWSSVPFNQDEVPQRVNRHYWGQWKRIQLSLTVSKINPVTKICGEFDIHLDLKAYLFNYYHKPGWVSEITSAAQLLK